MAPTPFDNHHVREEDSSIAPLNPDSGMHRRLSFPFEGRDAAIAANSVQHLAKEFYTFAEKK